MLPVIQPIFDAGSALWICRDGQQPIPLFCNMGVQLTAPVTGIVSFKLVVSSSCRTCCVPGGRISATVAEDVAWDPDSLSLDKPSVCFTVVADCDTNMDTPKSRGCQFRGLPSVVTWFRTIGACEPLGTMSSTGVFEDAGLSFGLQVHRVRASCVLPSCYDAAHTSHFDRMVTAVPTRLPSSPIAATAFCDTRQN